MHTPVTPIPTRFPPRIRAAMPIDRPRRGRTIIAHGFIHGAGTHPRPFVSPVSVSPCPRSTTAGKEKQKRGGDALDRLPTDESVGYDCGARFRALTALSRRLRTTPMDESMGYDCGAHSGANRSCTEVLPSGFPSALSRIPTFTGFRRSRCRADQAEPATLLRTELACDAPPGWRYRRKPDRSLTAKR